MRGEAVDAGFWKGRAVIPHQLLVHGELRPKRKKSPDPIDLRRKSTGSGMRRALAGMDLDLDSGVRGTYGLVGDDVAADWEAHAGAVSEGGGCGACAAAAQDAGPRRG